MQLVATVNQTMAKGVAHQVNTGTHHKKYDHQILGKENKKERKGKQFFEYMGHIVMNKRLVEVVVLLVGSVSTQACKEAKHSPHRYARSLTFHNWMICFLTN